MNNKVVKVVVKRSEWLRGQGAESSFLCSPAPGSIEAQEILNSFDNDHRSILPENEGKMCCMGFAACALGYSKTEITGMSIFDLPMQSKLRDNTSPENSIAVVLSALYTTNDNKKMSESEREAKIKAYGLEGGLDFEFID